MSDGPFSDAPRIDAYDKVRGAVVFGADDARPDILHASLAIATIPQGRVISSDARAARAAPGIRVILTHENLGHVKWSGFLMARGDGFQSLQPMISPAI